MTKKDSSKCITPYCRNKKVHHRNYCYKCKYRRWAENNPEMHAYHTLKNNAKRRGHKFTISFKYFLKFATSTQYIEKKGRSSESLTVDRIKEHLGYVPGNIQALENKDNGAKYRKIKCYNWQEKRAYYVKVFEKIRDSSVPF